MKIVKKFIKKMLKGIMVVFVLIYYTIKHIIKKLLGYKSIDEVKVPSWQTRPKKQIIDNWKLFYKKYRRLPAIVIDNKKFIVNGFSIYVAAAEMNLEYIKVTKVKKR